MAGNGHHIEVRDLWKVFGPDPDRALREPYIGMSRSQVQEELGLVVALREVSFQVAPGEIFVVMGLSGSGKSTLVRTLIRLVEPTRGYIVMDGEDVLSLSKSELIRFRRRKVAMVFQHYGLLPHRRVIDNVAYGLEVQGVDRATRYRRALEAIETVGLKGWEEYYPDEMSGGMKQRVGLARALAVDPQILLMDEPFSGLDPLIRREMQDELLNLQRSLHKTIIFITHDLNEALKLGDRIAIMRDGQVIQLDPPEAIVTSPADDYVQEFVRDVSRTKVVSARHIMRPPEPLLRRRRSPAEALAALRSARRSAALVVDEDEAPVGVLDRGGAEELVRAGARGLSTASLERVFVVGADASLEEIIPLAASTDGPIAVVDDRGRLLGEVRRGDLLAGICGETGEPQRAEAALSRRS